MPPLARLGLALVPFALAACYTPSSDPLADAERARNAHDWPAVVAAYDDGVRQGDPFAMAYLAGITQWGHIEDSTGQQTQIAWARDEDRSSDLYRRAAAGLRPLAERGDVRAQLMLGRILYGGFGTEPDTSAATALWTRAAEAGDLDAQVSLGWLVYMRRRDPRAIPMLTRAAEQGQPVAQHILYSAYRDGRLVEADSATAMMWLGRAAAAGDREAVREQRSIAASTSGRLRS